MSQFTTPNTVTLNQSEDARNKYCQKTKENDAGSAGKVPEGIHTALNNFKNIINGEELPARTYKKAIEEAIQIIECLQKRKVSPPSHQEKTHTDTPAMAKILQEIKSIKTCISQTHSATNIQRQSWAKVASQSEVPGTVLRIQDEDERREIARMSSEELVKKIGIKEVIGANKMQNGQVKLYFAGQESKEIMERQREWTSKLSATAQIASPTYQVLVHDIPFSFESENPEHVKDLQKANQLYLQGAKIQRAAWLKKNKRLGKTSGSMIVWFELAESADRAIQKGIIRKYELKATEIFKSGFRILQCFGCQKYGHIAKTCMATAKCRNCVGEHNTRNYPGKQEIRCSNYSRKHKAWDPACLIRISAKAKTILNRTQDTGRYNVPESQITSAEGDWQIVGTRKKKDRGSWSSNHRCRRPSHRT